MGAVIPGVTRHARDRAEERLGRDLTREEWLGLVATILEGRAVLLCFQENAEHYLATVSGVPLRVVWRPDLGQVVTVLRADMAAAQAIENARGSRLRPSLRFAAHYRQGKRRRAKTMWQDA